VGRSINVAAKGLTEEEVRTEWGNERRECLNVGASAPYVFETI
jgi:hypothetical protein